MRKLREGLVTMLLMLGGSVGCSSDGLGEPSGGAGGTNAEAGATTQGGTAASGAGASAVAGTAGSSPSGGKPAAGGSAGAGGTPQGGQAVGGGSNGGSTQSGGTSSNPGTPGVHYVGRVDTSDPNVARLAWSGTGAVLRFEGTSAAVTLGGGQEYTVVVDTKVQPKLTAKDGSNKLVEGLMAGEHVVELYRRTEANEGESQIMGFDFGGGTLLAPPAVTRRLEFIGDSITCGYGNEGANMSCGFTPQTENHYLTYAAISARNLGAELSTVAWSGKGVVCNYGDDASSCTNPLPTYYDRTLPNRAESKWDFARFQPDAVVINLGTNDFSTTSDPDQPTFVKAYKDLIGRIRTAYPTAHVLCTNGSMLSGADLDTVRGYIQQVVMELDDDKVTAFEITPQDGSDGYGCDWHPSLARHEKMATTVTAAIKAALGW